MMPVQFSNPRYLLLLPLVFAFLESCSRRTLTDMSAHRKRIACLLRCLLVTSLVCALAGLKTTRHEDTLAVLFLVDASKSVREDQRTRAAEYIMRAGQSMHPGDKAAVMTFAARTHLHSSFGQPPDVSSLSDPGITTSTDIGQALRQAASELEIAAPNAGKRIVLLSDGNENVFGNRSGNINVVNSANEAENSSVNGGESSGESDTGGALAVVPRLALSHILLDTVTLPVLLQKEASIDKIVLPNHVKVGEPFRVRVVARSLTAQTATISLYRDGSPSGLAQTARLHAGKNAITFEQKLARPGFTRYAATLDAPDDTLPDNNRGEGFVQAEGKPSLLYVADSPEATAFLRRALQSFDIEVTYARPETLPTNAAALQSYDSVFLSNVPASAFSGAQMTALQIACRDFGVGLCMVGGDRSFGAGGWRGTPIEAALPVSLDVRQQKRLPSTAVALVIEDLEIPVSVNMSIEASKATLDLLEPIDQIGVLDCNASGGYGGGAGVSPAGVWRIPMQRVTERDALKAAMQKLQDMGDPPSYLPFLIEAARVLNQTDASAKHIVFLGDGDAEYENVPALQASLQRLRSQGITLSTIETGATRNADRKFMADMAVAGGGQAYHADRPQELPRLLLKDQQAVSQAALIEEPFHVAPAQSEAIFKGIDWPQSPPLLGYNVTSLKPTALLVLHNADPGRQSDPIFAGWRYGLGVRRRSCRTTGCDGRRRGNRGPPMPVSGRRRRAGLPATPLPANTAPRSVWRAARDTFAWMPSTHRAIL